MATFNLGHNSYSADWLLCLCAVVAFGILECIDPVRWHILPEDMWQYKYPFKQNQTISTTELFIISAILPAGIMAFICIKKKCRDLNPVFLGFILCVFLNGVLTNLLKVMIGRPRPSFFYRCYPDGVYHEGLCTGPESQVKEGFKSFPSGHTSWAFSGLGYFSLFLCGQLRLMSERKGQVWKLLTILLPLFVAVYVAASRVRDYWHHPTDVLAGAVIGTFFCCVTYFYYHPSLFDSSCDTAYSRHESGSRDDFNSIFWERTRSPQNAGSVSMAMPSKPKTPSALALV
eukprot:Colp12_sorted_trinity150504_noHs@8718